MTSPGKFLKFCTLLSVGEFIAYVNGFVLRKFRKLSILSEMPRVSGQFARVGGFFLSLPSLHVKSCSKRIVWTKLF